MTATIAIAGLLVLLAAGMPVAAALGFVAVAVLAGHGGVPLVMIAQTAWDAIDKYPLVCIPFFVLAGNVMSQGDLGRIVLDLVGCLLRRIRGGMAVALAVAAVFFAAVNGSSVACAVALGPAAVRLLPAEGYSPRFAAAVVAVCGTLGLMIPPSLTFILIGSIVGLPITDLFIAGILPGLMEAALLGATTLLLSRVHGYGRVAERTDWCGFARRLPRASGALMLPVLVVGSIYLGLFTPTEVSALAALYAVLLAAAVYRTADAPALWRIGRESVMQTVLIYGIVLGAGILTAVLTRLGLSREIIAFVREAGVTRWQFLLTVNLVLMVVGMFLDGVSMIVLLAPVLFPVAQVVGVDPVHLAVIFTALVEVATLTPPVGLNLFVMSRISGLPLAEVVRGVVPFYATRLLALLLINLFPGLSRALL